MRITPRFVSLLLCLVNAALASQFESEDVVPVRINGRIGGRFWKRSEENPIFTLKAFGRNLTLNLIPDTSFLSPNRTQESEGRLRSCFFSGNVGQDENSLVAVSLCSGIFGSFITEGKEYLIEPKLRSGQRPDSAEQLHVIRRRILAENRGVPLLFNGSAETLGAESFTHGGSDARREARRKRFVSEPRFIETLAVADSTMTHFYGDEIKVRRREITPSFTVNSSILSLLNLASPRLDFLITYPQLDLNFSAVSLQDICGQKSCDTLGVADVGTMCDPKRSCSVIEDNGLQAAFTAAHELGEPLPGTVYNLDQQCQQIFGEEFVHCPNTSDSDICSQLWCREDGTGQCSTKNGSLTWADGTPCRSNGTCLHGACKMTEEVMQPLV
uniref:ADAMTS cysteine-rich domain-containing protein n=1 Tax=Poecilia mexicana TaxID=48701 RepID=A0A3B3XIQ3_9TELE